jgi:hypothetical protein
MVMLRGGAWFEPDPLRRPRAVEGDRHVGLVDQVERDTEGQRGRGYREAGPGLERLMTPITSPRSLDER